MVSVHYCIEKKAFIYRGVVYVSDWSIIRPQAQKVVASYQNEP